MKIVATVTVDVDQLGDVADSGLDKTRLPEVLQDTVIAAVKTGLVRAVPLLDGVLEDRFGDYATVDVRTDG